MATIQTLVDEVEALFDDSSNTNFAAATYLSFIKRAYRFAYELAARHSLTFSRARQVVSAVADDEAYDVASDFYTPIALFRTDTAVYVPHVTIAEWETILSPGHLWGWMIQGSELWVKSVDENVTLNFWYHKKIDTSALSLSTTTPFSGALDSYLIEHLYATANSVREMDLSAVDKTYFSGFGDLLIANFSSPAFSPSEVAPYLED